MEGITWAVKEEAAEDGDSLLLDARGRAAEDRDMDEAPFRAKALGAARNASAVPNKATQAQAAARERMACIRRVSNQRKLTVNKLTVFARRNLADLEIGNPPLLTEPVQPGQCQRAFSEFDYEVLRSS